jgi:NADH-quinone oxidoreductase subunit D
LNYGFTGPNLGLPVDYDVRVHTPYCSYQDFEFNIPQDQQAIVMTVFWCARRNVGIVKIIEQAYRKVQEFKGAEAEVFHADVPEYYLPEKKDVYTKMEALIYHFKIIMAKWKCHRAKCITAWKAVTVNWVIT